MSRKCNEAYMLELAHKLDAIEPAARAMLAALKDIVADYAGDIDIRRLGAARAAIAQAEAAGIKGE